MRLGVLTRRRAAGGARGRARDVAVHQHFDLGDLVIRLDQQAHAVPVVVAVLHDAADEADRARLIVDDVDAVGRQLRCRLPEAVAHVEAHAVLGVLHVARHRQRGWIVPDQRLQVRGHHAGETLAVAAGVGSQRGR
jgi:hypothetical protein